MLIKITKDCFGYPDGCRRVDYKKGFVGEIKDAIAEAFIAMEWAKPVKEHASKKPEGLRTPEGNAPDQNTPEGAGK